MRSTCKAADALIAAAVTAWTVYIVCAAMETHPSTRQIALGAAGGLTVLSLAISFRQVAASSTRVVTVAVAAAPRQAYYRGYGDAAKDAFSGDDSEVTTDLSTL